MGELKHGFGAAKMNKDADERIVPNGEYRDALNIEIVTSEGSDTGAMQTLLGNNKITNSQITAVISPNAKCVGSVADEKNNNLYYFIADNENYTDYIFQYNSDTGNLRPVVVDKWLFNVVNNSNQIQSTANNIITHFVISDLGDPINNITNVRPGMRVKGSFAVGDPWNSFFAGYSNFTVLKMKKITDNWEVYLESKTSNIIASGIACLPNTVIEMGHDWGYDRVLNFDVLDSNKKFKGNIITGINVIDDIIYWTDGETEPKKIDINNFINDDNYNTVGKHGTAPSGELHSFFNVYKTEGGYASVIESAFANVDFKGQPAHLTEENITVIKKSPLHPPNLLLSNTSDSRFTSTGAAANLTSYTESYFTTWVDGENLPIGTVKNINFVGSPDYLVGDLILLRTDGNFDDGDLNNFNLTVEILDYTLSTGDAKVKINYIQDGAVNTSTLDANDDDVPVVTTFNSILQREKPLYEFKFPRFAYRYKYQDNQYSCYSPFSEPAFLPGDFLYEPKDGYNLGMVNTLRSVYIMDFVTDIKAIPKDVIEIDILYKESNSTNVYTVKTVKYGDDEWDADGSVINTQSWQVGARTSGRVQITSEMVRAAVASNQLLRPWDNVPRTAKAQEIVGNRVVYANYLQNFNL